MLGQIAQDPQHLARQFGVEGRGRLVKAEDVRLQGQGAGNGHALLLPAGKLVRVMPRPVGKPHLGQQFPSMCFQLVVDLLAVLLVVRAFFRQQFARQHHILQRRILRKKVEILEYQSEVQPLFAQHGLALGAGIVRAPQRFARHGDRARVGSLQKVQTAQQRCFTGA